MYAMHFFSFWKIAWEQFFKLVIVKTKNFIYWSNLGADASEEKKKLSQDRVLFTYLVTLFSCMYFDFSASSMSTILFSKKPLKGMIIAPGSFLSTHSLILINLNIFNWINW